MWYYLCNCLIECFGQDFGDTGPYTVNIYNDADLCVVVVDRAGKYLSLSKEGASSVAEVSSCAVLELTWKTGVSLKEDKQACY